MPYVSQLVGVGAAEHQNDCGPSCVAMLIDAYLGKRLTPLDVYPYLPGVVGDPLIGQGSLRMALQAFGIASDWVVGLKRADVFQVLTGKRPLIAGIMYGPLVDAGLTERRGFRGGHFVTVVGIDLENYLIHDPYRTEGGDYLSIPHATFEHAWTGREGDPVPTGGAIVPQKALGCIVTAESPTGTLFQVRVLLQANIRSTPVVSGLKNWLRYVNKGDVLSVFAIKNGWYQIGTAEWIAANVTERVM